MSKVYYTIIADGDIDVPETKFSNYDDAVDHVVDVIYPHMPSKYIEFIEYVDGVIEVYYSEADDIAELEVKILRHES